MGVMKDVSLDLAEYPAHKETHWVEKYLFNDVVVFVCQECDAETTRPFTRKEDQHVK